LNVTLPICYNHTQNNVIYFKKERNDTILDDNNLNPAITKSENWNCWYVKISPTTCERCLKLNLRIFAVYDLFAPPLHPNCRCTLAPLGAIYSGTATINGLSGADVWLKLYGQLPKEYVNKDYAKKYGWKNYLGNLKKVLPNTTIGGDIYYNDKQLLPIKPGRIWYEADINYTGGYRNHHRLLYSNDGLLFVTYDHYNTFYEII